MQLMNIGEDNFGKYITFSDLCEFIVLQNFCVWYMQNTHAGVIIIIYSLSDICHTTVEMVGYSR